jgi:serine/threonine protein phosphatase PrpC
MEVQVDDPMIQDISSTQTLEFDPTPFLQELPSTGRSEPEKHCRVSWAARTEIGIQREHNEDKYDHFDPEMPHLLANRGRLWAVADGMGGHAAGQRASEFGLRFLLRDYFLATDVNATTALSTAILHANNKLVDATKQHPEYQGMGSTLVAMVLIDDIATIAHVGDSRAYLLRQGAEPQQLTQDHSWVEDQVRAGTMTRDEAEQSRYRNVISRCLGMEGMPGPDIQKITVQPGDVFVIVSDGITRYMQTDNIAAIVSGKSLSQAAMDIVDAANHMGGADNSTCVLVRIESVDAFADGEVAG